MEVSAKIQIIRRSAPKVLNMPRLFSNNGILKDWVIYLDNALKQRAKAPKQPLTGAIGIFYWCCYRVVI